MIDFHTHLLPKMDDGSESCRQSLALISEEIKCGIKKIILTPHFYAYENDIETFAKRREMCLQNLLSALSDEPKDIELYLGAEVYFFNELWRVEDIEQLCISGTNYILVELPAYEPFSRSVSEGLEALVTQRNLVPIIAHFERYLSPGTGKYFDHLAKTEAILQMNAKYLNNFWTKRKALSFFKKGTASLLGSDMHSQFEKGRDLRSAYQVLEKGLPEKKLEELKVIQEKIFSKAIPCYTNSKKEAF